MPSSIQHPTIAIETLSIRDFRGIDRLELDFRGPDGLPNSLVVLGGPNGCDKTAVLEAALSLAGGAELMTGQRGSRAIRRGATDYEIRATFRSDTQTWTSKDVPGGPAPPVQPAPHWYFSSWRATHLVGPVSPTVGRPGRPPAKTDENRLRIVKQLLVNAAAVERFEPRLPKLGRYSAIIEVINNAWREFYPERDETFAVEVIAADDRANGSFDLYLRTAPDQRLEVDLLGSGQLELFLFLSELALNEDREGIIFIDEPELHLDPQWHAPIVRALMRLQPRARFIVATHSPEIYDAAMSYERHFLVAEDDPRARAWPSVAAQV
jgi:hypothetical protein